MNRIPFFFLLAFLIGCGSPGNEASKLPAIEFSYPETRRDSAITDTYHDTVIADPFRWLEDDHSEETADWVRRQNKLTFGYIDRIPFRDAIENRLKELWDHERYNSPKQVGDVLYYFMNDGLQDQALLYARTREEAEPRVVLDPNKFSDDGTASMGEYSFSGDGKYLAFQVSEGGSDWRTIRVLDLGSGQELPDRVEWVKFSEISWYGEGFFYSRYPEPPNGNNMAAKNEFHSVYYHRLGTPQAEDELIFADRTNPQRNMYVSTTSDERFLVLQVVESTSGNALYFRDLKSDNPSFTPVYERFDADFVVVDNDGDHLLIRTNYQAPNWRLIRVDTRKPQERFWENILPERKDVLEVAEVLNKRLVTIFIHDVSSQMKVFDLTGKLKSEVELPGIGYASNLVGKREGPVAYFEFESFISPTAVYELDLITYTIQPWARPSFDFDPDSYTVQQKWFKSTDGTQVPMFIIHKKGLKPDGKRPTLLYGYGGFDISLTPRYNVDRLSMFPIILENDGVCAVANIRGGGEFGADWHWAGTREKKQQVFDDFISAAEYLVEQGYTQPPRLSIYGRSNGGLLVGACLVQRPELFGVALPAVGVLDMLRYHQFTIGWAWATDYGRSDDPEAFNYLIRYSPLHNVRNENYPATLITTADHDDRVVPAHSFKFAAALQAHQQGEAPVLIRIETSAGHGAGKPTSKKIEEGADLLAFLFWNMEQDVIYDYATE